MAVQRFIKGGLARSGLNLAAQVGQQDKFINWIIKRRCNDDFVLDLDIETKSSTDTKGTVLINLLRGDKISQTYFYSILAGAFQLRGYRPLVLLNDSALHWSKASRDQEHKRIIDLLSERTGTLILDSFDIDPVLLSEYTEPADARIDFQKFDDPYDVTHQGVPISKHALGELRARTQRYHIKDEHYDEYINIVKSGVQLVNAVNDLSKDYNIDAVIADHPYYFQGIVPHLTIRQGIPTYVFGTGYIDQKVVFSRQGPELSSSFYIEDELDNTLDQSLTPDEQADIDHYMNKRIQGDSRVDRFNSSNQPSSLATEKHWDSIVGVFPNLVWDGAYESENALFSDPFSWIEATIELAPENTLIIIKPHPSEIARGTSESIVDFVQESYPEIPNNIHLIEDGTSVSAYSLLEDVDTAIVYTSTVGIEASYHGLPVIVCSDPHYRDRGFTFDPENKGEYSKLLSEVGSLRQTDGMTERAKKYAHTLFIQKHIDFPYYETREMHSFRLNPIDRDTLKESSDLDKIVDSIMDGKVVI